MKIKFLGLLFGSLFFSTALQAQEGEVQLEGKQQLSLFFHQDAAYAVRLRNKASVNCKCSCNASFKWCICSGVRIST